MSVCSEAILQIGAVRRYDHPVLSLYIGRGSTAEAERVTPDPSNGDLQPPAETESTLGLVHRARAGDQTALEVLCSRYSPRLRRWASGRLPRYARDLLATEDLVQEALLQTVRRIGDFRSDREGAFQLYVRQTIMNRIRDQIRRPHVVQATEAPPEQVSRAASPLEELIGRETLERYEAALSRLSPEDQEAVVARLEMAGTYQELALVLNKPTADAARMAVGRAILRLAKEMGHEA
jgi:RNA polymerase sigma-70 factor (ECF subfamily)